MQKSSLYKAAEGALREDRSGKTKAAFKIYDSHCHIYPDKISLHAVDAIDRFYEILPPVHFDGTVDTLKKTGKAFGISHFVVHSVATAPEQVENINRFIARTVEASPGMFTGLGTMHLLAESLEKDFEQLLALHLKGVKLHPDIQKFNADDKRAMRIYEMCEAKGLPVVVHTGDYRYDYSNPSRIVRILKAFPRLKFIGAHFGGWSVWEDALKALPDFPNIHVDTSSSFYWLSREKAMEIIRAYGSERVMFGTDYPMWPQKNEMESMKLLDLSSEERENIFWRSCSRLFAIDENEDQEISHE